MQRIIIALLLCLITLLAASCSQTDQIGTDSKDLDSKIEGPAFVLFYTDN